MKRDYYFAIVPKEELRKWLAGCELATGSLSMEILGAIHIWSKSMSIYPNVVGADLKLLFLADLLYEVEDLNEAEFRETVGHLIGNPPYDISVFDQWWELRLIKDSISPFEVTVNEIGSEIFSKFNRTGIASVDAWLQKLKDK